MVRSLAMLGGIVAVIGLGAVVSAGPRSDLPRPCPDVCVPNVGGFGYFSTTWRQWPGEAHPEQYNPRSIGAEVLPTPAGQEQLPLPRPTPSAKPAVEKSQSRTAPPAGTVLPPEQSQLIGPPADPVPMSPLTPQTQGEMPGLPIVPPRQSPKLPEQTTPTTPMTPTTPKATPSTPAKDSLPNAWRGPMPQTTTAIEPVATPIVAARTVVPVDVAADPRRNEWMSSASRADLIADACEAAVSTAEPTSYKAAEPITSPEVADDLSVPPIVLSGYCVVELATNGRWVLGDLRWTVVYKGGIYRFSGPAQRQRFLADPDAFTPVNSGNDPVLALDENRASPGQTAHCAMYNGRLYMFSSAASQARFNQSPRRYAAGK